MTWWGTGTGSPEHLHMSHPWECSRQAQMGHWASWWTEWGWNWMGFKVPSTASLSVILGVFLDPSNSGSCTSSCASVFPNHFLFHQEYICLASKLPTISGAWDSMKPSLANKEGVQGGTEYHTLFHKLLHQEPCPTFSLAFSFLGF